MFAGFFHGCENAAYQGGEKVCKGSASIGNGVISSGGIQYSMTDEPTHGGMNESVSAEARLILTDSTDADPIRLYRNSCSDPTDRWSDFRIAHDSWIASGEGLPPGLIPRYSDSGLVDVLSLLRW
jgi:hypothetical protein